MQKRWWQRLHWPEYGSELLGTAFLIFIAIISQETFRHVESDQPNTALPLLLDEHRGEEGSIE